MSDFNKNPDFGQNFRKLSDLGQVWSNFSKNLNYIRNISILVQHSQNLEFGHNFWKIPIEVKISEISRFWPKFIHKVILIKIFENFEK